MSWNFNQKSVEYKLYGSLTDELINQFGLLVKYVVTNKMNGDLLLGEFSHMEANNDNLFDVYMYPEDTSGYQLANDVMAKFGMLNYDTVKMFISRNSLLQINQEGDPTKHYGDLVIMPSRKVFEITDIEDQVHGINNLFTMANEKNVYLLTLKPYNYNHDELNIQNEPYEQETIPDFGKYFDIPERETEKVVQNTASVYDSTSSANNGTGYLIKGLDPVFGDLG